MYLGYALATIKTVVLSNKHRECSDCLSSHLLASKLVVSRIIPRRSRGHELVTSVTFSETRFSRFFQVRTVKAGGDRQDD